MAKRPRRLGLMTMSSNHNYPPTSITSAQNPQFKVWRELLESKGIRKHNSFLVSGQKVVNEMLTTRTSDCASLLLPEASTRTLASDLRTAISSRPEVSSLPAYTLSAQLFNELDVFGTGSPIVVMKSPEILAWNDTQTLPQMSTTKVDRTKNLEIELWLAMSDPSNLGATLRCAAGFGANKVVLLKECASPFLPRAVRAASGTMLQLRFYSGPSIRELDLIDRSQPDHINKPQFIALDLHGTNIRDFAPSSNLIRLLIGEEGQGIPNSLAVDRVKIPMSPQVESLNAAVSAAIALYEFRCKEIS